MHIRLNEIHVRMMKIHTRISCRIISSNSRAAYTAHAQWRPLSNRIEYKRQLNNGLEKEAVAFLNSREGGIIYIGIDDSGEVFGVFDPDDTRLKIKDRLKNNIQPSVMGLFDVIHEVRENTDIIRINVASGSEKAILSEEVWYD